MEEEYQKDSGEDSHVAPPDDFEYQPVQFFDEFNENQEENDGPDTDNTDQDQDYVPPVRKSSRGRGRGRTNPKSTGSEARVSGLSRGRSTSATTSRSTESIGSNKGKGKGKGKGKKTIDPNNLTPAQKERKRIVAQKMRLLPLVEKHQFLYDKRHPDHKNKLKCKNTWVDITIELGEKSGRL